MKDIQAVFIDRDGTIGGTGHFIHPEDFIPYHFSKTALALLKQYNIKMFAFTNQHRISRGEASVDDFRKEFALYGFDDAFICPHSPDEFCKCHKPGTALLEKAAQKYGFDLTKAAVIGDVGSTDMLAAHKVGVLKILVRTGWGESSLNHYRHTWEQVTPDYTAENLLEAVKWLAE